MPNLKQTKFVNNVVPEKAGEWGGGGRGAGGLPDERDVYHGFQFQCISRISILVSLKMFRTML